MNYPGLGAWEEGGMRRSNILLVDDEPQLLKLMAMALARHARNSRQDWQIHQAMDAATALSTATELSCGLNVMVTDIQMPGTTGDELIRQIRMRCPYIDVLAISGAMPERSSGLPNVPFLKEPFEMPRLAEAVQGLLDVQL